MRKYPIVLLLVCLLIGGILSQAHASVLWLGTWDKRIQFTIDSGDIDENLTDFPVLIYISASSGYNSEDITSVFDELQNDGNRKKIAVTTSDTTTQCYVEIDKWDTASEEAWIWVKVPSISSSTNTVLYLYYDIAQADNDSYVGDVGSTPAKNVWETNYAYVDHMNDDPDTSHTKDSTSNSANGTKVGANEPLEVTTQIGNGQKFDNSNDTIQLANNIFDTHTVGTVEALVKTTNLTDDTYFGAGDATNNYRYLEFEVRSNHLLAEHRTFFSGSGNTTLVTATYYYFAVSQNGTNPIFYVDALSENITWTDTTDLTAWFADIAGATHTYKFGVTPRTAPFGYFSGTIDEFRVSDAVRSDAWISATYDSFNDGLIDWGSEETFTLSPPTNLTLTDNGANTITANWTLGAYSTYTLIRISRDTYPTSVTDGEWLYYGTGTSTNITGWSTDTETLYMSAWGYYSDNTTISSTYTTGKTGGNAMILLTILALCIGMTVVGAKSSYYLLKFLSGGCWLLMLAYWVAVPPGTLTAGDATHTIGLILFIGLALAMFFMPMWYTKTKDGMEVGGFNIRIPRVFGGRTEDEEERIRLMSNRQGRNRSYQDKLNGTSRGQRR